MKKILPIVSLGLFLQISTSAQSRIYVNEYLNIGVGAKGLAMAGAQSASSNDVYSPYWNAAGLRGVDDNVELGLMHAEYFAGIFKYDYAAAAIPFSNKNRVLGLSFMRFGTDNIPYTLDYVQPDGSLDDTKLKGFSAGDYAIFFTYAQALDIHKKNQNWESGIGVNGKILFRNVGRMANAWGAGLDIGLQTAYKKRLKIGVSLKDITTSYTAWTFKLTEREKEIFYQTGNEIPIQSYELMMPRVNFGFGYHFIKPGKAVQIYSELGMDVTTDGRRTTIINSKTFSADPRLGLELSYKNTLFLRGGVTNFYQATDNSDTTHQTKYTTFQPSIGVGFKVKALSVDYAFTSLQMQDNPLMSHIISLKIAFNTKRKAVPQKEEIAPVIPQP